MREPGRAGWRLVWRLFAIGSQEIDQLLIMLGRTQLLQLLIRSRFGESGPCWRMSIVPILCHLPLSQRGPPPLIFSEMSRARRPPSTPGQGPGCGGSIRIRLGAARRTARTHFFPEWPKPFGAKRLTSPRPRHLASFLPHRKSVQEMMMASYQLPATDLRRSASDECPVVSACCSQLPRVTHFYPHLSHLHGALNIFTSSTAGDVGKKYVQFIAERQQPDLVLSDPRRPGDGPRYILRSLTSSWSPCRRFRTLSAQVDGSRVRRTFRPG